MGLSGNITTYIDFHDGVNSEPLNQRFINRIVTGIYYGADLTKVNNTTVTVSAFDIEITDGNTLMKATSTGGNNVTVSTSNVWVVFRWAYTGSSNDIPSILGVTSVNANDLVIGKCVFSGSTLTGFDLSARNDAQSYNKTLLVEATGTPSWAFKVRAGQVNSNTQTYFINEQIVSYPWSAPVTNPRIDVVIITGTGGITVLEGLENVSPTAPSYANNIPLALVYLTAGQSSITNASLTDVRGFVTSQINYMDLASDQTAAGKKTFTGALVIPTTTSDPGTPATGQIWLRTDF